jgi:pimeloyl-ACP methyl ester carboxylesterase
MRINIMISDQTITGFAPVHKGQLYYEYAGSGKPILLIHAGVADHTMWEKQFGALSKEYQVICYDTRGYGSSRTEKTEYSNRQDIIDLLDHLGIDQIAVIGISRGGQIAIDFTLEHPERVSALVAVAPGISGYDYQPDDNELAKRELEFFSQMDTLWEKKDFDGLTNLHVHVWADGPSQPEGRAPRKIREYIRRIVRADFDRRDGEATPIPLQPPAIQRLAQINKPTLIMIGEFDFQANLAAADELECQIQLSRKVGFSKTAHMIPMEQPDKFNQVLFEFLDEVL